jgi:RES domain.
MEEEEARRYCASDDSVCARCFHDKGIRQFIRKRISESECSVCGRKSKKDIAAPADQVLEFILERLHNHYETADGNAPFDKETWDYFVETWDLDELISEELSDAAPYETLEWIQKLFKGDVKYCRKDWQIMSPGEALTSGWERFSKAIKHETRFMFFREEEDDGGEPFLVRPTEMLDELGKAIRRCGLLTRLPAGTRLFRVRGHKAGVTYSDGSSLGPPPENLARSAGRMNAPGIVVAYASFDEDTALSEATGDFPKWSVGEFELLQDIRVVDLTEIPDVPSIFEQGPRESLQFLNKFAEDVSQPFTPDLETHVEYTPTQVVSEYLRHRFRDKTKKPVRGILYWSAKASGTKNLALFMGADEVDGYKSESWKKAEPLIKLVSTSERVRKKKAHAK